MKRTDLKVGETYLSSSYTDWRTDHLGVKVTVLSLKPLTRVYDGRGREPYLLELDDGTTIELGKHVSEPHSLERSTVVAVRIEGEKPRHTVVETRHIRGLWDECRAIQDENREKREARERQVREANKQLHFRWRAIRERLEALDIPGRPLRTFVSRAEVELSFDQLEYLLDKAERKG